MPTESCLVKTIGARSLVTASRGSANAPPVRQGKENERSKGYANRFIESGYPRFSILWARSTRYPYQYYGRIQHHSSPRIPGSAYTVPNRPVVGPLHDAILPHAAGITGMPTESCLMKTMAQGAGSGRRAVGDLPAVWRRRQQLKDRTYMRCRPKRKPSGPARPTDHVRETHSKR
jgi:hypothetical protein